MGSEMCIRDRPKNKLAAQQIKKLKVYAGPEHPHAAQQPKTYEFNQVAQ